MKEISLNEAWYLACIKLWNLCLEYDRDTYNITMWDAFKLLYIERVPQGEQGRRARGVNNPFVSWEDKNDTD